MADQEIDDTTLRTPTAATHFLGVEGASPGSNAALYGKYLASTIKYDFTPPVNMSAINTASLALEASGGGVITIGPGTVTLDANGVLRSGVSIFPVSPELSFDKNCPDLGFAVEGGTIFQGTGTEVVWQANKIAGGACTADAGTDFFTRSSHGLENGAQVWFTASVMPSGITSETVTYFVINKTTNTYQVSLTSGGAAVDFSTNGTTVVQHIGGAIGGVLIGSFGAKNVKQVYDIGAPFAAGIAFSEFGMFVAETVTDWVANIYQAQHIKMTKPHAFEAKRGIRFAVHESHCAPGISIVEGGFLYLNTLFESNTDYPTRWGYVQENELDNGFPIDNIYFPRCQVNTYGGGGSGNQFTISAVNTSTETLTLSAAHGRSVGEPIYFSDVSADLPAPLLADESYVIATVPDTDEITLEDRDGNAINITGTTTGGDAYGYPGDTRGFVSKGAAGNGTSNSMRTISCFTDGVQNIGYDLLNSRSAMIEVQHVGAGPHGPCDIRNSESTNSMFIVNDPDARLKSDPNSGIYHLIGGVAEIVDSPPKLPYVDVLGTDAGSVFYPIDTGNFPLQVKANAATNAFEPVTKSNNTWPHIGLMPVRGDIQSGDFTIGNDRAGWWRSSSGSIRTGTLPSVVTVGNGAAVGITAEGAANVTVAPNGSDTINGTASSVTLTAGDSMILYADNQAGGINWVAMTMTLA